MLLRVRPGGEKGYGEERGGRKRRKEKDGKEKKGGVPSYASCLDGHTGGEGKGAPNYTQIPRATPDDGEEGG